MISFRPTIKGDKDATVIFLDKDQIKRPSLLKSEIKSLLQKKHFTADAGTLFPVSTPKGVHLLVGLGKRKDLTGTQLRILARNAFLSKSIETAKTVEVVPSESKEGHIIALIEGIAIGTYKWRKYIQKKKEDKRIDHKMYTIAMNKTSKLEEAVKVCEGVSLARDLVNENADVATPTFLEKTIRNVVKGNSKATLEVLSKKELKAKGLGLILAVNQGSNKEPKLVIVRYKGTTGKGWDHAFIGKGMTYDTGGLNIKPSGHIETMKMDMGGAAAVIGTLKNILALKPKKNIIFACALAENAVGPDAYKPGDVFTGYAGKSVEIGNTDAEGRLILADAISYVNKNYKPSRIINICTLTGACVVALGHDYTGLVSTDDKMARDMIHASNETDDRAWRMPSYKELKGSVKSQIADIRNLGFPRGVGGMITAAEFLRQFTEDAKWAHLDIAGTAFVDNGNRWYFGHGATGSGVRLMTRYLQKA